MATTQKKVRRSAALEILQNIPADKIFGITFVTRGDCHSGPQLRTMSCAKGVTRHLRGGQQPYKPSEHGLMTVLEVLSPEAALADYRAQATAEIHRLDERISNKQAALDEARTKLSAKNTKANRTSVNNKVAALLDLEAKKKLNELKLGPGYVTALRMEIEARIQRKQTELEKLAQDRDSPEGAKRYADAVEARFLEGLQLVSPEETLRIRYRNINLSGITRLVVDSVEYTITTKPSPALPEPSLAGDTNRALTAAIDYCQRPGPPGQSTAIETLEHCCSIITRALPVASLAKAPTDFDVERWHRTVRHPRS